jgi:hypothetical protein
MAYRVTRRLNIRMLTSWTNSRSTRSVRGLTMNNVAREIKGKTFTFSLSCFCFRSSRIGTFEFNSTTLARNRRAVARGDRVQPMAVSVVEKLFCRTLPRPVSWKTAPEFQRI